MSPAAARGGRSDVRRRWATLGILCAGLTLTVLGGTVVGVALSGIQDDLGFTDAGLAWVVNAYLIGLAGLLLLAGRLGDVFGLRTVFLVGVAVFALASVGCGLAVDAWVLVGARVLQGAGGAFASAGILSMISTAFPEARERARALSVYGFIASSGAPAGLLVGSVVVQVVDWRWIFFLAAGSAAAVAAGASRLLPAGRPQRDAHGIDVLGALLITGVLATGVAAVVTAGAGRASASGVVLALGVTSLVLLVGFAVREMRAANPLVPLRALRSRTLSGAAAAQALTVAGMFGMFFLGALFLQQVMGFDALRTGLAFASAVAVMGAMSMGPAERLIMRFGAHGIAVTGAIVVAAGLALFARAPTDAAYGIDVLPCIVLVSSGAAVAFPALTALALSRVPADEAGLASGLVTTSVQIGGALGLSVLTTVAALGSSVTAVGRADTDDVLAGGYRLAFLVAAGFVAASALTTSVIIGERRRR